MAQVHGSTCADAVPSILWICAKKEGFVMFLAIQTPCPHFHLSVQCKVVIVHWPDTLVVLRYGGNTFAFVLGAGRLTADKC